SRLPNEGTRLQGSRVARAVVTVMVVLSSILLSDVSTPVQRVLMQQSSPPPGLFETCRSSLRLRRVQPGGFGRGRCWHARARCLGRILEDVEYLLGQAVRYP